MELRVMNWYGLLSGLRFIRNSNVVNGGHILQIKLIETILNKHDLKWKENFRKVQVGTPH